MPLIRLSIATPLTCLHAFHRWWCPVNGKVLFDPLAVPGDFFNKLVIPDFGGATTASLPYLAQVNARGIIVFKTDYGHVCCIPLGMSEISSIDFNRDNMYEDAPVTKGLEMGMFNYGGSSFVTIYERLPGWQSPTAGIREWSELPEAARRYVERLSELVGAEVGLVSAGPDREQTVIRGTSALAAWFD